MVASQLAGEAACFANTPGGGALIVGVSNAGAPVGAIADAEWLRRRVYELSDSRLTVEVTEATCRGVRLLVIRCPQAVEPIPWRGRYTWRVDDRCVPVDPTSWHDRRREIEGYDWSIQDSFIPLSAVRPQALEVARAFLRDGGRDDLVDASDRELLERLNVVAPAGTLTNAGALTLVGRGDPAIDYMRRVGAGMDTQRRLRVSARSLLEELDDVERAIDLYNELRQVERGLVVAQFREIPPRAAREAIVNGIVHRDWNSQHPTTVEHLGSTLVVTSPGGFVGGVTSTNILSHPSRPRYRALAELFAALGVAEREGIGVDRMTRDMIALGYPPPVIREIDGPSVRATLHGGSPNAAWVHFVGLIRDTTKSAVDLTELLLLRDVVERGWTDGVQASRSLQQDPVDSTRAIERVGAREFGDGTLFVPVVGTPDDSAPAWMLSTAAHRALSDAYAVEGKPAPEVSRNALALGWARARGRISTTELASIARAHATNVGGVLRQLEEDGYLEPSRATRRGPGFHYRWIGES